MLPAMARLLNPGGVLAILDLFKAEGMRAFLTGAAALPVSVALQLVKTGHVRPPRHVRDAWAAHGLHDTYLTLPAIRQICERVLPGARVRQHLLWRYSILWKRPL